MLAAALALAACDASAPSDPGASCDAQATWVSAEDPLLVPVRASGALTWDGTSALPEPLTTMGTLVGAEGTSTTTLDLETPTGPLTIEVGLSPDALGVLPIGREVAVALGDGVVLADPEGRIVTAVVSRRGANEASALSLRFRQEYAECVQALDAPAAGCARVVAAPLVDVVTGASVVRMPPGGIWRIPDDEDPRIEIEILRSVRAPAPDELAAVPSAPSACDEVPAQEIAAVVRHLR